MFTARTISKLMDKWAIEKTPTEVQITDALETIGRMHEYCLQLEVFNPESLECAQAAASRKEPSSSVT